MGFSKYLPYSYYCESEVVVECGCDSQESIEGMEGQPTTHNSRV